MCNDGWGREKEKKEESWNLGRARNVVEAVQRIVSFLAPPNPV